MYSAGACAAAARGMPYPGLDVGGTDYAGEASSETRS